MQKKNAESEAEGQRKRKPYIASFAKFSEQYEHYADITVRLSVAQTELHKQVDSYARSAVFDVLQLNDASM